MIINSLNGQIINSKKIYLHDDILKNLIFHRNSKNLHVSLSKSWPTQEKYTIDFFADVKRGLTCEMRVSPLLRQYYVTLSSRAILR